MRSLERGAPRCRMSSRPKEKSASSRVESGQKVQKAPGLRGCTVVHDDVVVARVSRTGVNERELYSKQK